MQIKIGDNETAQTYTILTDPYGSDYGTLSLTTGTMYPAVFSSLSSVEIPAVIKNGKDYYYVVEIGMYAFYNMSALTTVTLPYTIENINLGAFTNCKEWKTITVDPANAYYHTESGVLYNSDKTELIRCPTAYTTMCNIANGTVRIAKDAFIGCTRIETISIPSTLVDIDWTDFSPCIICSNMTINVDNPIYQSYFGIVFNKDRTSLVYCPIGKSDKYALPIGVESIGEYAFRNCTMLPAVDMSAASVSLIMSNAFVDCTTLSEVVFSSNITEIRDQAFNGCKSLKSIYLPDTIRTMGSEIFIGCTSLNSVNIPSTISKIPNGLFNGCKVLREIYIPRTVTEIGDSSFAGTGLGDLSLGINITKIGDFAFLNCTLLTTVDLPNTLKIIGEDAFMGCSRLESLIFPDCEIEIGDGAFSNCTGLTSIAIPSAMKVINLSAFSNQFVDRDGVPINNPSKVTGYTYKSETSAGTTVYKRTAATYYLTFYSDGYIVEIQKYNSGESQRATPEVSKDGYRFMGWNTKSDGTGDGYEVIDVHRNITYYAQYKSYDDIYRESSESSDISGIIIGAISIYAAVVLLTIGIIVMRRP